TKLCWPVGSPAGRKPELVTVPSRFPVPLAPSKTFNASGELNAPPSLLGGICKKLTPNDATGALKFKVSGETLVNRSWLKLMKPSPLPGASAVPAGKLKKEPSASLLAVIVTPAALTGVRKLLAGRSMNVAFAMAVNWVVVATAPKSSWCRPPPPWFVPGPGPWLSLGPESSPRIRPPLIRESAEASEIESELGVARTRSSSSASGEREPWVRRGAAGRRPDQEKRKDNIGPSF